VFNELVLSNPPALAGGGSVSFIYSELSANAVIVDNVKIIANKNINNIFFIISVDP